MTSVYVPASRCLTGAPVESLSVIVKPSPWPTSPVSTGLSARAAPAKPATSASAAAAAAMEIPALTSAEYAGSGRSVLLLSAEDGAEPLGEGVDDLAAQRCRVLVGDR